MRTRSLFGVLVRRPLPPLLIAAQVAIAMAVLTNVSYLVHLRIEAVMRPTGIDLDNVFWIASRGYGSTYHHGPTLQADLLYLNSLQGVTAAAASMTVPQTYGVYSLNFSNARDAQARKQPAVVFLATEKTLDALGLKLIAGRIPTTEFVTPAAPNPTDALGRWAPEVMITQSLAEKLFPAGDAVGKTIYASLVDRPARIGGVVAAMQVAPLAEVESDVVLVPAFPPEPSAVYLVRTQPGRRAEVMAEVEKAFTDAQPGRFISRIETLNRTAAATRTELRSSSVILSTIVVLVLTITAVGIFGLAASSVVARSRSIGTLRAVGAQKFHVLRFFLLENLLITTVGITAGGVLAPFLGAHLGAVYSVRLPLHYLVGSAVFLWGLGACAVLAPALRAASIPPAIATRKA